MKRYFILTTILLLLILPVGCSTPAATPTADPQQSAASQVSKDAQKQSDDGAPAVDVGLEVKSVDELTAALHDPSVTKAHISGNLSIDFEPEETFEREGFQLTIDEGAEVTIQNGFIPVFFGTEDTPGFVVNGTLAIAGSLNFGAMTLMNNGTLEVLSGATLAPGMSTIENHGQVLVDAGGTIRLERGTALKNFGTITNLGEIDITSDGGSLQNASEATLENNGDMKFNGDYQNEGFYSGAQREP